MFDQDLCNNLWYELNPRVRCAFGNVCICVFICAKVRNKIPAGQLFRLIEYLLWTRSSWGPCSRTWPLEGDWKRLTCGPSRLWWSKKTKDGLSMVLMSFQMKVGTLIIRRNLIIPRSSMIQKEFKLEIYTLIIPNLRPQKKKFYDALENSKSSLPSWVPWTSTGPTKFQNRQEYRTGNRLWLHGWTLLQTKLLNTDKGKTDLRVACLLI